MTEEKPASRRGEFLIRRLVSGGQTGVDRGALDAAIELGLSHGGWCPRGRKAEDGVIPSRYRLQETDSKKYHVRTQKNVEDSDGTLILHMGELAGGTELTRQLAIRFDKPCLIIDLNDEAQRSAARQWIIAHNIAVLNVAGPRESSHRGIAALARQFVLEMISPGGSSPGKA